MRLRITAATTTAATAAADRGDHDLHDHAHESGSTPSIAEAAPATRAVERNPISDRIAGVLVVGPHERAAGPAGVAPLDRDARPTGGRRGTAPSAPSRPASAAHHDQVARAGARSWVAPLPGSGRGGSCGAAAATGRRAPSDRMAMTVSSSQRMSVSRWKACPSRPSRYCIMPNAVELRTVAVLQERVASASAGMGERVPRLPERSQPALLDVVVVAEQPARLPRHLVRRCVEQLVGARPSSPAPRRPTRRRRDRAVPRWGDLHGMATRLRSSSRSLVCTSIVTTASAPSPRLSGISDGGLPTLIPRR